MFLVAWLSRSKPDVTCVGSGPVIRDGPSAGCWFVRTFTARTMRCPMVVAKARTRSFDPEPQYWWLIHARADELSIAMATSWSGRRVEINLQVSRAAYISFLEMCQCCCSVVHGVDHHVSWSPDRDHLCGST
jgi:hypothetical protein